MKATPDLQLYELCILVMEPGWNWVELVWNSVGGCVGGLRRRMIMALADQRRSGSKLRTDSMQAHTDAGSK